MALGMTKDSMLDLQSLVREKDDNADTGGADTLSLLTTGQSKTCASEYQKMAEAVPSNPVVEEEHPAVETEEETKARLSHSVGGGAARRAKEEVDPPQDSDYGEEEKKQDSYGQQYTGFSYDYDSYSYDPYQAKFEEPPAILGGRRSNQGGFLCCIFPWLAAPPNDPNDRITENGEPSPAPESSPPPRENSVAITDENKDRAPLRKASSGGEDDDISTGDVSVNSDKLGEKLSEKDRQAVLARLRLAQPDRSPIPARPDEAVSDGTPQQKGLLKDIPILNSDGEASNSSDAPKGPKSILKRQTTTVKSAEEKQLDASGARRRSLFPSYETTKSKKSDHRVKFAPMARVVTVKSQKDMVPEEKSSIWWQKWDYDDFRKTGRIITRAMLEGGSEIWLASNQSWQVQGQSKKTTLQNAIDLTEQGAKAAYSGDDAADLIQSTGDKWWHKFGHSRRGLEHIASIKEGSERQANVRHAIRAVVDEQRRQKAYMREDPEKLRMVSIHNTSWARDLAVAAGASDADAVKSNFDEERKSREFYLLKMARSNSISSQGKHVPAFMQPALSTNMTRQLDANTSAQIMYRRKQQRQQARGKDTPPELPVRAAAGKRSSVPPSVGASIEPIHDPEPEKEKDTRDLAKRAAGFSHDGAEQVNMAAVLSGMGAVPKNATPVGA